MSGLMLIGKRGTGKSFRVAEWLRERVSDGKKSAALVAHCPMTLAEEICNPASAIGRNWCELSPELRPSRRHLKLNNGSTVLLVYSRDLVPLRGPRVQCAALKDIDIWGRDQVAQEAAVEEACELAKIGGAVDFIATASREYTAGVGAFWRATGAKCVRISECSPVA